MQHFFIRPQTERIPVKPERLGIVNADLIRTRQEYLVAETGFVALQNRLLRGCKQFVDPRIDQPIAYPTVFVGELAFVRLGEALTDPDFFADKIGFAVLFFHDFPHGGALFKPIGTRPVAAVRRLRIIVVLPIIFDINAAVIKTVVFDVTIIRGFVFAAVAVAEVERSPVFKR